MPSTRAGARRARAAWAGRGAASARRAGQLADPPAGRKEVGQGGAGLVEVVAAELLLHRAREYQRDHRLAHHRRRGDRAYVGALVLHLRLGAAGEVDRVLARDGGGDRLHRRAQHQRLAVGGAALEAARAVGGPHRAARPPADGVLGGRTGQARDGEALAELDALDGVDAEDRLGDQAVELAVPLGIAAQARGHADRGDLEDAAERFAGLLGRVDARLHPLGRLGVGAAHRRCLGPAEQLVPLQVVGPRCDIADGDHVAVHADAQLGEERLGYRARRHARGGLAGAGALPHDAEVAMAEFQRAREIGVAWARDGDRRWVFVLPVGPVAVLDPQGDRRAGGHAVRHPAAQLGAVALDQHAPAAAIAALTASQVLGDRLFAERYARRHSVQQYGQARTVRLARREKPPHAPCSATLLRRHYTEPPRRPPARCHPAALSAILPRPSG